MTNHRFCSVGPFVGKKSFLLLCTGRAGACLGTMAFAGALPVLRNEWQLDAASAGIIQTTFSISNAFALFAASWFCDYQGPRKVYLWFSWLGALALLLFALYARSFTSALVLITLMGLTQGGAYTPAIMLSMQMNEPQKRGYAVGMMLCAGSIGYLLSVFIAIWGATRWGAPAAFYFCALGALLGAACGGIALKVVPDGHPFNSRTHFSSGGVKLFSGAALFLLIGYVAHCWELLGSWAWTPGLLSMALAPLHLSPVTLGLVVATAVHLPGMLSTVIVGALSDYFSRISLLIIMGAAGAGCSLLLGWSVSWGIGWTLAIAMASSFFIFGDSGVLSAAMADSVPPGQLGRMMGLRSLFGFGIGSLSPWCFGLVMDATHNWQLAYIVLSAGGTVALLAALVLGKSKKI